MAIAELANPSVTSHNYHSFFVLGAVETQSPGAMGARDAGLATASAVLGVGRPGLTCPAGGSLYPEAAAPHPPSPNSPITPFCSLFL